MTARHTHPRCNTPPGRSYVGSALVFVSYFSVAENLANQSTQLVLLISSAAWGDAVAAALERHVGKRYVIVSRQQGPRGNKPVKTMRINDRVLTLNEYDAERDESVILEF